VLILLLLVLAEPVWHQDDVDIYRPIELQHVTLGPENDILLVHRYDGYVHRIGQDGTLKGKIGRQGKGPGELEFPTHVVYRNNEIFVHQNGGVSVFDDDGRFLRTLRSTYRGHRVWMTNGWVIAESRFFFEDDLQPAAVYWAEPSLRAAEEIYTWPRDADSARVVAIAGADRMVFNFNPAPEELFLVGTPDGKRCYLRTPNSREILVLDAETRRFRTFVSLPANAPAFNSVWADQRAERIKAQSEGSPRRFELQKYYPDQFPVIRNLRLGPDGMLYVERWTNAPDKDRLAIAYDPEGRQSKVSYSPTLLSRLVDVIDGHAIILTYDPETEVAGLAKLALSDVDAYIATNPIAEPDF